MPIFRVNTVSYFFVKAGFDGTLRILSESAPVQSTVSNDFVNGLPWLWPDCVDAQSIIIIHISHKDPFFQMARLIQDKLLFKY